MRLRITPTWAGIIRMRYALDAMKDLGYSVLRATLAFLV